jgi:hypothetical protein
MDINKPQLNRGITGKGHYTIYIDGHQTMIPFNHLTRTESDAKRLANRLCTRYLKKPETSIILAGLRLFEKNFRCFLVVNYIRSRKKEVTCKVIAKAMNQRTNAIQDNLTKLKRAGYIIRHRVDTAWYYAISDNYPLKHVPVNYP